MISLVQFLQKGKIDKICGILRESGIVPKCSSLELESTAGEQEEKVLNHINLVCT